MTNTAIELWNDPTFIQQRIAQQDAYIEGEWRVDKIQDAQLIKKRFSDRLAELKTIGKYKN